jgi:peptidoglycan/LPS O-acetylase OafA/YrhL
VRFGAALSVALYHLSYLWWIDEGVGEFHTGLAFLHGSMRWGWIGVPVFFVLSGVVIAFSAEGKTASQMLWGRFLRLYPGAWVCATLTLAVIGWDHDGALASYLRSLALYPGGPWIDAVYWTLGIEMAFYALVAGALRMRLSLTILGCALTSISSGYWFARTIDFSTGGHLKVLFSWAETPLGGLTLVTHGCHFALGVLLWSVSSGGFSRLKLAFTAFAAGGALINVFSSGRFYILSRGGEPWEAIEPVIGWTIAVGLIVGSLRWNYAISNSLSSCKMLFRTAGLATYPLYLLHNELGRVLMILLVNWGSVGALLLSLTIVTALSFATLPIERSIRRLLSHTADLLRRTGRQAARPGRPLVEQTDCPRRRA